MIIIAIQAVDRLWMTIFGIKIKVSTHLKKRVGYTLLGWLNPIFVDFLKARSHRIESRLTIL
jgi:hypothetical protein